MEVLLEPLLESALLQEFTSALLASDCVWRPGEETAGWYARTVKHNQPLDRGCTVHQRLVQQLQDSVLRHPLVAAVAFPDLVHGVLFSRTGPGEGYGRHVDNAWMAEGRSDLLFTLFLSEPEAYEGGDLLLGKAEQRSKRPLSLRSPQLRVKEEKADRPAHSAQFCTWVSPGRHQLPSRHSAAAVADHQHCEHVHALDGE